MRLPRHLDPFAFIDELASPILGGNLGWGLHDAGEHLEATVDVPGLAAEEIQISVTQHQLTVRGATEDGTRLVERSYSLPFDGTGAGIDATLKLGVLTVTVQKPAQSKRVRQIEITSED